MKSNESVGKKSAKIEEQVCNLPVGEYTFSIFSWLFYTKQAIKSQWLIKFSCSIGTQFFGPLHSSIDFPSTTDCVYVHIVTIASYFLHFHYYFFVSLCCSREKAQKMQASMKVANGTRTQDILTQYMYIHTHTASTTKLCTPTLRRWKQIKPSMKNMGSCLQL